MRLNVFLQKAGVGSRREAERMVADGRVSINGMVALATTPVEDGDSVYLDGNRIAPATKALPRLFMLNKPLDVLVTTSDPQGRQTVFDLEALQRPGLPRLMNVGRLDVNSEGLLLMSSDGPLAQQLMSPKSALERVYRVRVHGWLSEQAMSQLRAGPTVDGIHYRGVDVSEEEGGEGRSNRWYRIILREGKNREIRKLMEHYGCVVNRLVRVSYGPFELGRLASGVMIEIEPKRVAALIAMLEKVHAARVDSE